MKISRVKHVLLTCIIFLIVIAILISVFSSQINELKETTGELVHRVIATQDIAPGEPITEKNVTVKQVPKILNVDNLVYRLKQADLTWESVDKTNEYITKIKNGETARVERPNDDLWAVGKIAATKIHKGEMIVADDLKLPDEIATDDKREYSIPFDSLSTGGYNVKVGNKVDICVLYGSNTKTIQEYQKLEDNKVIDIVLAKKEIMDIRDEAGNSKRTNPQANIVPGYICFNLTYDEINKIELAKKQGNVFVGIVDIYPGDPHVETFMVGETFPSF